MFPSALSLSQTAAALKPIRILIADDHPIVRQGLVAILNDQADMVVVAEASDGLAAIAEFKQYQPDVLILDLRMPRLGGVEVIEAIRSDFPGACIIMFTIYDTDEDIYRGLRAGAKSYLLKDTPCQEVLKVIRNVYEGQRHIPAEISQKLASRIEQPELTGRELEVLQLLVIGQSNRELGALLSISERTVKFHINNIFTKLGVSDRTQAVIQALKRGLARLEF